jgi:hypothetical protein
VTSSSGSGESPALETDPVEISAPALADRPSCDRNNTDCLAQLGLYLAGQDGYAGQETEDAYVISYQVCSTFQPSEFVEQGFKTGGSTAPIDVAEAYAKETFQDAYEQASFEGASTHLREILRHQERKVAAQRGGSGRGAAYSPLWNASEDALQTVFELRLRGELRRRPGGELRRERRVLSHVFANP